MQADRLSVAAPPPGHNELPVTEAASSVLALLTVASFSLFGFIIGIWAKNFEQVARMK
jgi:hypothetical protein